MTISHISNDQKIQCLDKILRSNTFKNESAYRKILSYYRENIRTDHEVDFSETSIALDALEKDLQFNPYYDSSVRVVMHRLRNNLVNYYLKDGKKDIVKIHIPIGDYNPLFYTEKNNSDSEDYCIQMMRAAIFQIEYTLSEQSVKLYDHVIQTNKELLSKKSNFYYSCSVPFNHLHNPFILNRKLSIEEKDLENMVNNIYNRNPSDIHTLLLKSYHSLYLKKNEEAYQFSQKAYLVSTNNRHRGLSLVLQFFSGIYDSKTTKQFYQVQNEYSQHPPYWLIVNIIIAIENNELSNANEYAKRFNSTPSKLSKTLHLILKSKMNELTEMEMQYISENKEDFSADYLSYFLSSVIDQFI